MGDFVRPEVVRLSLSGGRWIDVKKRLNAGESRKMFARVVKDMTAGEKAQLDPEQVGLTKLVAYVLGWSFTDDDGKPVPFSQGAMDNVDPDLYAEMIQAIDAHIEAQDAARDKEKNKSGGEKESSAISSSPSDVAGVLIGSAN
jgi:hypothetical protein